MFIDSKSDSFASLAHALSPELPPYVVLALGLGLLMSGITLIVVRPNFLRGGLLSDETRLGMLLERRAPKIRHAYGLLQLFFAAVFMILAGLVAIAGAVGRIMGFMT